MRRRFDPVQATALAILLVAATAQAAIQPISARRRAEARTAARLHEDGDLPPNVNDCSTARAARVYGSTERCLRERCAGHNVVNAFVTDGAQRLRRNPCAGVDPFDRP